MMRPTNGEGPTVAAVAPQGNTQDESPDCHSGGCSGQALHVIAGEAKAAEFLTRLHSQQADPDELAVLVSMMYGAALRGFCRVIAKAIGGVR
ncbi:MAG: hypothetical protein KGN16_01070 [Burkholderiales bacterium]|nr:hypothetical protein [Burkholderiales bacterium]